MLEPRTYGTFRNYRQSSIHACIYEITTPIKPFNLSHVQHGCITVENITLRDLLYCWFHEP